MQIDLTKIPTFVITLGRPDRVKFVSEQLASVGITPQFVQGIQCEPGIIGCGLSHLRTLELHAKEAPFLILEDDVAVTEDFKPVVEVPYGIDMVYLGVSIWGNIGGRGVNYGTRSTSFNEDFLRIHNMLSTHAILYLSNKPVKAFCKKIISSILCDVPFDVGLSDLQSYVPILTPNKPFFYQAVLVGGHEEATRRPLQPQIQRPTKENTQWPSTTEWSDPSPQAHPTITGH